MPVKNATGGSARLIARANGTRYSSDPMGTGGGGGGGGSFTPPFTLPGPGEVVSVGTNTFNDILPSGISGFGTAQWNASAWVSYGCGVMVPDYSAGGALVIGPIGGHNHDEITGQVIFDCGDVTWKWRPNTVGVPCKALGYPASATTGSPRWEFTGTGYPAPPHPYKYLVWLPASLGGGTKGSVMYAGRSSMCVESNNASPCAHSFDLDAGVCTLRVDDWSAGPGGNRVTPDGEALLDVARQRVYLLGGGAAGEHNYTTLQYIDLSDFAVKTLGAYSFPPGALSGGSSEMVGGMICRINDQGIYVMDPDNANAGWTTATHTGSLQSWMLYNRQALLNGKLYGVSKAGGSTLHRITPPANLKTGTWAVDTVALGTSLYAHPANSSTPEHYGCLVTVPAYQRLAWFTGGSNPVQVIGV